MTVYYGNSIADATLTTACDMVATTSGGAETSKQTLYTGFFTHGEITSQGGTVATVSSIPATPTGRGWVWNPGAGTYANAVWGAIHTLAFASISNLTSMTVRFFRYDNLGVYHLIGVITLSPTFHTAKTTYTWTNTTMASTAFAATDRGYTDAWANGGSNFQLSRPTVYESSSSTQGVANDVQITTSTFTPAIPSRTIQAHAALLVTSSRTIPAVAAISVLPRILSGGFALMANGTGTASFDTYRATSYPDPSLLLTPVGRLGASAMSWNAVLPTNTSLGMDIGTDSPTGVTWVDMTQQNGGAFPFWQAQPSSTNDLFTVDSSANYLSTSQTGGTNGTWTMDTANSRLVATGGTNAIFLNQAISTDEIDLFCDMDRSDAGGLVWRFLDSSGFYLLTIADASSNVGTPNLLTLSKVVSNVSSTLATAAIVFVRGTYHRFRVTQLAGSITVTMDGAAAISYSDSTPLAAGQAGLYNNGGATGARFYQLWLSPQGQNVTGFYVYTRQRLATTDATVTPQVLDLTISAYDPHIGSGAQIPQVNYLRTFVSANYDDLAQKSDDYYWLIGPDGRLSFRERTDVPAPWILDSSDSLVQDLTVEYSGDLYSNRQVIENVIDQKAFTDAKIGDGHATSFAFSFPFAAAPTLTLNGNPQTVGQKGVSTNKNWYWQYNDPTLYQDSSGTVLISTDTLAVVNGLGLYKTDVVVDNLAGQLDRQSTEGGGTGIVENVTDLSQLGLTLNIAGATALGQSLNARYGVVGRTAKCNTVRTGLMPGMLWSVFIPQRSMMNVQLLITSVDLEPRTYRSSLGAANRWKATVEATELPNARSWSQQLTAALGGKK